MLIEYFPTNFHNRRIRTCGNILADLVFVTLPRWADGQDFARSSPILPEFLWDRPPSLGRLLRIIERMYRLNLSVYDVNPVKNVIHSIHRLHVEDSCNVVSLDDVLL